MKNVSFILALVALIVMIGCPETSWGQDKDHEGGFFLRLSAGGGPAATEFDDGVSTIEFSGSSGDVNLAIGGIVSPNLALHATVFGWLVEDPDLKISGLGGQVQGDLDLSALGVGVTYYFMPINFYVSSSVGIGSLTIEGGGIAGETGSGPVFDLSVGKEWWVSSRWGLGLAVALGYHSVPEQGVDENWSGISFAVRFSATLN